MRSHLFCVVAVAACFAGAPVTGKATANSAEGSRMQQQAPPVSPEAAMTRYPLVFVVRYTPGPAYDASKPILGQKLGDHGTYMRERTQDGTIIAAGPTFDQPGGLVLVRTLTLADAQDFVRNDPAVAAGIFVGEITDWRPVFDAGSIFRSRPADTTPQP
jgi:uncharacterized protein YciI